MTLANLKKGREEQYEWKLRSWWVNDVWFSESRDLHVFVLFLLHFFMEMCIVWNTYVFIVGVQDHSEPQTDRWLSFLIFPFSFYMRLLFLFLFLDFSLAPKAQTPGQVMFTWFTNASNYNWRTLAELYEIWELLVMKAYRIWCSFENDISCNGRSLQNCMSSNLEMAIHNKEWLTWQTSACVIFNNFLCCRNCRRGKLSLPPHGTCVHFLITNY